MNAREERDQTGPSYPRGDLESPFLEEELFVGETEPEWEARLAALETESPYLHAFEQDALLEVEPASYRQEVAAFDLYEGQATLRRELWEGEIGRTAPGYIRWVQQALNRVLGTQLSVDGIIGTQTRRAIRRFQEQQGLAVDGTVGRQTEAALIAAGAGQPPTGAAPTVPIPAPSAPTSFVPVAVEDPGGGRIRDKRDPVSADLVTVTGVGGRSIQLHRLAADAWRALVQAARREGLAEPLLLPTSGYRSSSRQAELFRRAVARYGSTREARKWVAPPGGSAHQSGRAIDFFLGGRNSSRNVANLSRKPAYLWLVRNAQQFGFYPYEREPWHWEYNPPARAEEWEEALEAFGLDEFDPDVSRDELWLEEESEWEPFAFEEEGFPDEESLADLDEGIEEFYDEEEALFGEEEALYDEEEGEALYDEGEALFEEEEEALYDEEEEEAFFDGAVILEVPSVPEEFWTEVEEEEGGYQLEEALYAEEAAALDEEFLVELEEEELVAASTLRRRIVEVAKREWENWGRGTKSETDPAVTEYLQAYHSEGVKRNVAMEDLRDPKWHAKHPWSAVFISYVMRDAGAGDAFRYGSAHTEYIAAAKKASIAQDSSKFQAYEISAVRPEVGDLVCRDRPPRRGAPCAGTNFANVDRGGISHSDIVVEVFPDYIVILGGNTAQAFPARGMQAHTVGQRRIRLNERGFVDPHQGTCNYFAIVKPPNSVRRGSSTPSGVGSAALLPGWIAEAVKSGLLTLQAAWAMLSGQRDINTLTNMIFYARHPDLPVGYKIQPHEKQLARDWLRIRDNVVKPLLRRLAGDASNGPSRRTIPAPSPTPPATPVPGALPKLGAGMNPPTDPNAYRKFRLTTYYVADQNESPTGAIRVPIYDDSGRKIAEGSPKFFAQLSLEGSGRLTDGRVVKVTGKRVAVSHGDYAEVLAYHRRAYARRDEKRRREGKKPIPTAYSGIFVEGERVVRALAFSVVPASKLGIGYGLQRGIPYVPFRTLAADIGVKAAHEEKLKGKGGLVPPGSHVYVKEYDGLRLPDGTTHDGWFIVNDTGGGIFGAHFDVFVGTRALRQQVRLPSFGQVWFAGIERRVPQGYTYGLK